LLTFVSDGNRAYELTARFVDVVFVPVAFVQVRPESVVFPDTVKLPLESAPVRTTFVPVASVNVIPCTCVVPTTCKVEDGTFVPRPNRLFVSSQ
jgi:hypothetical protein